MKTLLKKIFTITSLILSFTLTVKSSYAINDTLGAVLDNTLYENSLGQLSNGSGQYVFTGNTLVNEKRRTVISFGVENSIPPGAIITEVKMVLYMSKTIMGSTRVDLHRVTKAWGEGGSDAFGEEGRGTAAQTGDATWIHTFFNDQFWDNSGGDYDSTLSANTNVNDVGYYTWTSAQMVSDVQNWVNNQTPDYGWILIGDEVEIPTAKRFDSRQNPVPALRPRLIITYTFDDIALRLGAAIEGMVYPNYIIGDTLKVYLRNAASPYQLVDSAASYHTLYSWFVFPNAASGSYYIETNQRNSINTWSKLPQSLSTGLPFNNYDFTTANTQAFGNNLVLKEAKYCIYSGDVNKDGFVNLADMVAISNSAAAFQTGYVVTDVNGDYIVDLTDLLITANNDLLFVQEKRP